MALGYIRRRSEQWINQSFLPFLFFFTLIQMVGVTPAPYVFADGSKKSGKATTDTTRACKSSKQSKEAISESSTSETNREKSLSVKEQHAVEISSKLTDENPVFALQWRKTQKDTTSDNSALIAPAMTCPESTRSPQYISRKLLGHKKDLQECYHRFLKINPKIKGKMLVRISIDCAGQVQEAQIVASDIDHEKFKQNLIEVIQSWQDFDVCPASLGNRVYLQTYEFGEEKDTCTTQ